MFHWAGRWPLIVAGAVLAGPLVCATSQAVNDWYDRHVDAINEPDRPIPSGRIPGQWGLYIGIIWTGLSLVVASQLGYFVFVAACIGLALAWAYSAPPLRLKSNGWYGNTAVAACYEGLPWLTGAAVMSGGVPSLRVFAVAALYSLGAHGIMTLNDFKSVEGGQALRRWFVASSARGRESRACGLPCDGRTASGRRGAACFLGLHLARNGRRPSACDSALPNDATA